MCNVGFENGRGGHVTETVAIFNVSCQVRSIIETLRRQPLQYLLLGIRSRFETPINLHHEAITEEDTRIILRRWTWNRRFKARSLGAKDSTQRARVSTR